jgi:hypothetical protein
MQTHIGRYHSLQGVDFYALRGTTTAVARPRRHCKNLPASDVTRLGVGYEPKRQVARRGGQKE